MDSRIIRTKKKLQDGLIDLLKQNSILDISVSELCRTANVDRNTFYSHYSNISELKDDVLSVYTKKAIERIQANAPTYDFEGMLIETCRLIQETQELTVLIYRSMLGPSDLLDLINACNEAVLSIFFMKNPSVEREKIISVNRFATGGATLMLIDWCRNGMIESPEEVSKKIAAYTQPRIQLLSLAKTAVDRRKQLSDQRPVIQIDALAAVGGDDGQVFFHIMHVQLFGQHGLKLLIETAQRQDSFRSRFTARHQGAAVHAEYRGFRHDAAFLIPVDGQVRDARRRDRERTGHTEMRQFDMRQLQLQAGEEAANRV